MIRPDVDIRLVDRAIHRNGPMESEAAAPPKHTAVVADIPGTRNHKLLRVRAITAYGRKAIRNMRACLCVYASACK